MYETILGREGFRKGTDLYFKRHDGQAVTCDDFLAAMANANDEDLSGLQRWYCSHPGIDFMRGGIDFVWCCRSTPSCANNILDKCETSMDTAGRLLIAPPPWLFLQCLGIGGYLKRNVSVPV
jgi:hypothetical protein